MGPRIDFVGLFPLEVLELKGRPYTELWGAKTPRYLLPETNKVFTSNVVLGCWRAGGAGRWEVGRGRRRALGGGAPAAGPTWEAEGALWPALLLLMPKSCEQM